MVFVLLGLMILGLVMDLGLLAIQRNRLDHAADAAARAAAKACQAVTIATAGGTDCLADTAARYLQANLPDALLEDVRVDDAGRVTLEAALVVQHPFAALWSAPPTTLLGRASAKM